MEVFEMKTELKRAMLKHLKEFINDELIRCLKNEVVNLRLGTNFKYLLSRDLMRYTLCNEFYEDYGKLVPETYYEIMKELPVLKGRYEIKHQELTSDELIEIDEYLKQEVLK